MIDSQVHHLESRPAEADALVFTGRDGARLRRSKFSRRHWKPALERVGLNSEIRFHDLRHTHVAFRIAQGMREYRIMRRLGHASIKTTIDLYGHMLPEEDDACREGLDNLYRAAKSEIRVAFPLH